MTGIVVRLATGTDAERAADLIASLGGEFDVAGVAARLTRVDSPQLVAQQDGEIVGLCGLHVMTTLHRSRPVGRITVLVVDGARRGAGIGKALVEAAERYFRDIGCELMEVTSHNKLVEAHAFYDRLGFEQTSKRFAMRLD